MEQTENQMRDIRQDLKERLAALARERRGLEAREEVLRQLLAEEEARWAGDASLFSYSMKSQPSGKQPSVLRAFLIQAMADHQIWSLERLKDYANEKGVDTEGRNLGQALHGALVSMKRKGLVERIGNKGWKLIIPTKATEAPAAPDASENMENRG